MHTRLYLSLMLISMLTMLAIDYHLAERADIYNAWALLINSLHALPTEPVATLPLQVIRGEQHLGDWVLPVGWLVFIVFHSLSAVLLYAVQWIIGRLLRYARALSAMSMILLLSACSSIDIRQYANGTDTELCNSTLSGKPLAIYWQGLWRTDQKDIDQRQAILRRGIERFFASSHCSDIRLVRELDRRRPYSDAELIADAHQKHAERVVIIQIHELTPNLYLYLSPILWQTQNEVLMKTRVLDVSNGRSLAEKTLRRQRGGAFTFHGSDSLPEDFQAALRHIF